jgi:hypothetical protein
MEAELPHQENEMARQAIWESIARTTARQLITGYSELIQRSMDQGFNAFLLSFMFKPLAGSKRAVLNQMNDEVQRVYSTLVTRIVRNPRAEAQKNSLPFLFTAPDYPVFKQTKQKLADVTINNGLHLHGVLCIPLNSRLRVNLPTHFSLKKNLYVKIACYGSTLSRSILQR